jgi:hypothetical protein
MSHSPDQDACYKEKRRKEKRRRGEEKRRRGEEERREEKNTAQKASKVSKRNCKGYRERSNR